MGCLFESKMNLEMTEIESLSNWLKKLGGRGCGGSQFDPLWFLQICIF